MIAVSDAFKSYLAQDGRTFKMKLVSGSREYGNTDESHIDTLKIESTLGGDNVGFGNTGCAKLDVTIFDQSGVKIAGNYLKVYIGADLNGVETWEQLGEFKAEKPTVQNGAITFVGYDRMNETGKTYTSGISFKNGDVTAQALWADMCKQAVNDSVHCEDLPSDCKTVVISKDCFSGNSIRVAMGYLAAYLGCNAVVNRKGKFEMRPIQGSVAEGIISPDTCETPETEEDDYQLGYIICNLGEDEKPLTEGTGARGFSLVCPLMTTARLNTLANAYLYSENATSPIKFRVGSVNVIKGDFRIEVGDRLSYADGTAEYVFPVMKQTFEFDGGIMNTLESLGKTPEEESGSVLSLEERLKKAVNDKAYSAAKSQTAVIRDFSKAINGALGLYETEITNANGSKQTYLHNRKNISDSTYIATINAAGFAFATGEGCWNGGSPTFTSGMTAAGNAVMNTINTYKITAGQILVTDLSAFGATIGRWTINDSEIKATSENYKVVLANYNNTADNSRVLYCQKKDTEENTFWLLRNGEIKVTSGLIGGWRIGSSYTGENGIFNTCGNYEIGMKSSSTSTAAAFYVRDKKNSKMPFWVSNEGVLSATGAKISGEITATSGSFTGEIKATSGEIAGITIASGYLKYGTIGSNNSFAINPSGTTTEYTVGGKTGDKWALMIGSRFGVTSYGTIYATNAKISGEITATSGSFTGEIKATSGEIAGITIASGYLKYGTIGSNNSFAINPSGTTTEYTVGGKTGDKWALMIGSRFGVTSYGTIYATNAKISGEITGAITSTGVLGAEAILCSGTYIGADMLLSGNLTFSTVGSAIRFKTSATTTNIGIRYATVKSAGCLAVGIDSQNLRLYGKAVYLGATSTAVSSDARLKTEIAAFTPVHEAFFKALRPRSYRYTEGTSDRTHFGFIAQDVKEAIESSGLTTQQAAVYVELESDRDGFDGTECALRYDEFISLNTHMIQKLYQEIDCLKERMTQYESNVR